MSEITLLTTDPMFLDNNVMDNNTDRFLLILILVTGRSLARKTEVLGRHVPQ
jgi:hypothetical protein